MHDLYYSSTIAIVKPVESSFALRLFVAIAREKSFSTGASLCGIPQSTASRRIARLETELGGKLFTRTTRVVSLTEFGSSVFAAAVELLSAEAEFDERVSAALSGNLRLLLPLGLPDENAAVMAVKAEARGVRIAIETAPLSRRRAALRTRAADAVLVPVAHDEADWNTPLGLASTGSDTVSSLLLAALRPHRDDPPEIWTSIALLPDDTDSTVRTCLEEHAIASGLAMPQIRPTTRPAEALATALSGEGFLCCSPAEARRWRLDWQPLADLPLSRPVALRCRDENERARVLTALSAELDALYGEDASPSRREG